MKEAEATLHGHLSSRAAMQLSDDAANSPDAPAPPSAPFQYSLLWLFAAITGVAVFFALWIWSPGAALAIIGVLVVLWLWVMAAHKSGWYKFAAALGTAIVFLVAVEMSVVATMQSQRRLPVIITVRDRTTGEPIPGANVQLFGLWSQPPTTAGQTGPTGSITLRSDFTTDHTSSLFVQSVVAHSYNHKVSVAAPSYKDFEWVDVVNWEYTIKTLEIVVSLEPEK